MISAWKSFLLEKSGDWDLPSGGDWDFLLHNNYHPHCSNMNLLWFHNGAEFPGVVTKVFRQPELPRREFQSLEHVFHQAPQCAPKPLYFGLQGGFWTLWMEGVPGCRYTDVSPARLHSIVEKLSFTHQSLRVADDTSGSERYRRMVAEPIATLEQFGSSNSVRQGCARLASKVSPGWLALQPVIPQHGDLFLGNVLFHKNGCQIIDWEGFGNVDFPYYDLFTLLFSLLNAGGQPPERRGDVVAKEAPALVRLYASKLGISAYDVPAMLPLTLVNWFHLQWTDGRKEFATRMYGELEQYFNHQNEWEEIFVSA